MGYNIRGWTGSGRWQRRHEVLFSGSITSANSLDFLQWAREIGIECPKLEVFEFPYARGLRATADIAAGEVFLKVPWEKCLAVAAVSNYEQNTQVAIGAKDEEWQLRLTLRLLDEFHATFHADKQSQWYPYISSVLLPLRQELAQSLPVHWSEQLLDVADSISTVLATEALNAKQWRDYRWTQVTVTEHQRQRYDGTTSTTRTENSTDVVAISRADFDWAMDCVQTRNCRVVDAAGTTVSALVPFFDLMNHSPLVDSVFFKDEVEGMLCVRYDGHGVLAGEEVCLNYRTVTDATDVPESHSLVGADYDLFSYGFCSPVASASLSGSLGSVEINLPRDAVRAILLADLDAAGTTDRGTTAQPRSPSQARMMAVARAARDPSVRLGGTFRVYQDGIDGHLMTALRLLAFANSSDLPLVAGDEQQYDNLEEEVVSSSRYDVPAMVLLLAVLDDTIFRIDNARQQALTLSTSTVAASSLSMLAESKITIGLGCKSWAQNYMDTLHK